MTAFITHCCKSAASLLRALRLWLALLVVVLGALAPLPAQAGSIEPTAASLSFDEDGVALAADFSINLGSRLEDALLHGIALVFKLEFVLERPRKYWVSEHIMTQTRSYRLTYSSLTRQYRINYGSLQQNFASIEDAIRSLGRVVALPIEERNVLRPGTTYEAAVRLSLDRSQLPKPFQIDALTNGEWQVDATTRNWKVTTP
jgi:hypothetical protein